MSAQNGNIQPYLFFGGRCEEALEFYKTNLGAQVDILLYYKDSPEKIPADRLTPGFEEKVMHSAFRIGKAQLMASDGCGDTPSFAGFSLSLELSTQLEAERIFAALSNGGEVTMPLTQTFWSPCFGMLTDRFGLGWMITIPAAAQT